MKEDQAIETIRSIRRQISLECDHDPHKLVQHYIQRQKQNARKLRKGLTRSSLRRKSLVDRDDPHTQLPCP